MKTRRTILSASFLALAGAGAAVAATAGIAAPSRRAVADEALIALAREGLAVYRRWVDRLNETEAADHALWLADCDGRDIALREDQAERARAALLAVSDEFSAIVDRAIEIQAATAEGLVAKAALQWLASFAGLGGPCNSQDERIAYAVAADAFRLMGFADMEGGGE